MASVTALMLSIIVKMLHTIHSARAAKRGRWRPPFDLAWNVVKFLEQMRNKYQNPGGSRARRWYAYLWHEWASERRRQIAPAFARPNPAEWSDKLSDENGIGEKILMARCCV
jgi:hypothetical protein